MSHSDSEARGRNVEPPVGLLTPARASPQRVGVDNDGSRESRNPIRQGAAVQSAWA
jgi:hypothetical protein